MLNLNKYLWIVIAFFLVFNNAYATDAWTINLTPSATYISCNGSSPIRNALWSYGATLDAQYLERFGFALGEQHLTLTYKTNIPTLQQDTGYASVRQFQYVDCACGVFKYRLDGYYVNSNDPTNETNDVKVINPIISFLNYKQTLYWDLGYAYSSYGQSKIGNDSLNINQVTPTLSFGFNDKFDWLQMRLYDIYYSNAVRCLNRHHTDAVEFKWTHYIFPCRCWYPEYIQLGALLGKRLYAVDSDALLVYNIGDMQKQTGFVTVQWRVNRCIKWFIQAGSMSFQTNVLRKNATYLENYIYLGLNFRF